MTCSGGATVALVAPQWPGGPPGRLLLGWRRRRVLRASPSLAGGLPLRWLSLAKRPFNFASCASAAASCWRSAARRSRLLEQLLKSRGRHRLCGAEGHACLFDRPERTLGASGG